MIHASPLPGHFLAPNSSLLYSKQPPLHPRCPLGRLRSTEVGFCFFWISAISAHSHPTPDHPVHFTYTRPPTRLRKPASAPFFQFSEANSSVLVHFKIRSRGGEGLGVRTCRPRYWPVTHPGQKKKMNSIELKKKEPFRQDSILIFRTEEGDDSVSRLSATKKETATTGRQ
jgi:hypothetical protein